MAPPPTSSHSKTRPWERLQSQRGILAVENVEYIPQCLLSFLYQHKAMNLAFCREHLARFLELQWVWFTLSVCPSLSVWEWSSHTHSMSCLGSKFIIIEVTHSTPTCVFPGVYMMPADPSYASVPLSCPRVWCLWLALQPLFSRSLRFAVVISFLAHRKLTRKLLTR